MSQLPSTAAEAKKVGSLRYATGRPCKYGHTGERYTSNQACTICDLRKGAKRSAAYRAKDPFRRRMQCTRSKCLKEGIPFEEEAYYAAWAARGAHCPCLGVEFEAPVVGERPGPDSPELDRIVPELGYVRGNIWVICHQANKMKNNGTWQQLMRIAISIKEKIDA